MKYVYVLQSESDQGLYIGYSKNLKRRLSEHFSGKAQATACRGPWKLIYYEAYIEEEDAMGRERFLKSGAGRKYLDRQLKNFFERRPRRRAT